MRSTFKQSCIFFIELPWEIVTQRARSGDVVETQRAYCRDVASLQWRRSRSAVEKQ